MKGLLQITLDEDSTNLIREQISHLYLPKQEYHVTLAFNVDELTFKDLIGLKVQFNSTRVLSDNKIQALEVLLVASPMNQSTGSEFIALPSNTNWPPKTNHHITLSHTLGTPPKLSNQLPEYHTESKPVKLTLSGIVEFKSFS